MSELKREVKQVLLGRTILLDNGKLSTLGPDDPWLPSGVIDGALEVRIFGVAKKRRVLLTDLDDAGTLEVALEVMKNIGRGVILVHHPDVPACMLRYVLTRPAMLTVGYEEDGTLLLTAWTGRSLFAWLALSRAIRDFEKHMPETLHLSEQEPPEEKKKEKKKKERPAKEKKQRRNKENEHGPEPDQEGQ